MKQPSLFNPEPSTQNQEPVECLGRTFPNDEERRNYFLKKLCEGLEELHAKLGGVPFTTGFLVHSPGFRVLKTRNQEPKNRNSSACTRLR